MGDESFVRPRLNTVEGLLPCKSFVRLERSFCKRLREFGNIFNLGVPTVARTYFHNNHGRSNNNHPNTCP